jgi:hypothetical protein
MQTPGGTGRGGSEVESWLTRAGTIAGALAGLAGFVYLVGGIVMWLRFRTADLPADQGVALMAREQLFVVGLRLMILPLLVTGALVTLLFLRATSERTRRLVRWAAILTVSTLLFLLVVWAFGVAGWPTGLAVLLDVLVLTGVTCAVMIVRRGVQDAPALTFLAVVALILVIGLGAVPIDDWLARICVVVAALLVVAAPLAAGFVPRWLRPLPARLWLGAGVLALVAAVIFIPSGFWPRVAFVLGAVVVLGVLAIMKAQWPESLSPRGTYRRWWLPLAFILGVGLVVPWSFASVSWPIALGLLLGVWYWRIRNTDRSDRAQRRRFARSIAITAVIAAAIVSIGRQLDEPVQLLHATVTLKAKNSAPVEGVYVNASGDQVYLGNPGAGTIVAVPRSEISELAVGPPDDRAPSPSLLSRLIPGDERFSARPLEFWCNGEKYHWDESHAVCRSHPTLYWKPTEGEHIRDFQRLGLPLRVKCPPDARRVCQGWVILRSRKNYARSEFGVPRPVLPAPVRFVADVSQLAEVCLTITDGEFGLLRGEAGETPVEFEAIVARDPEGETVFDRGEYWLKVGTRVETRPVNTSDCEPNLRILKPRVDGETVDVTVIAWPRAKSVTPRQVAGAVRLSASSPDGDIRRLGRRALKPAETTGSAHFKAKLPPGTWTLEVRYDSVVGVSYPQALDTRVVVTSRSRRASGGTPAASSVLP